MRLIVVGAFAAIVALLFVISAQATPTTEAGEWVKEGDDLWTPHPTVTNATVQSGRLGPMGDDTFSGNVLSSQWQTFSEGVTVNAWSSIGPVDGYLYMRSSSGAYPYDSRTYIYQDAIFPNNHSIELHNIRGSENWGAIGTFSSNITIDDSTGHGVAIYTTGSPVGYRVRASYRNETGSFIHFGYSGTGMYNWTLSIEKNATHYICTGVDRDSGYVYRQAILATSVWNNTNQTRIGIGDLGLPTGGNAFIDCYFDNYTMSNKPSTSYLDYYQYIPYGSTINYTLFEGNLTNTTIWGRAHNNYSGLIASAWQNLTGTATPDNTSMNRTLATNFTGSTVQLRIWFNHSLVFLDKITFGGLIRDQTWNLTVGLAHAYEDVYDAVNGTVHGDEVYITNGTYENRIIFSFTNITLMGESRENTRLKFTHDSTRDKNNQAWEISNYPFNLTVKTINTTTSNVFFITFLKSNQDDSQLTINSCNFYDAYYPIYTRYTNVTVENSYFDYNQTTTTGVSKKAIRVETGDLIAKNNTFHRYFHGIYVSSGNGLAEYNTIYGVRTGTGPYDDAGGIVWYPWRANGTTILRHNYINGASWGISMEETDICHIYQNHIIGCDIGISVVQRDPPNYWRPSIRGYGGINYIHNNTLENNMKANGFNLYGHQIVFMDGNIIRNATGTATFRPAIYVYRINPGADIDNTGIYYLNNTLIENCGVGLSTRSFSSAYGSMAVHVNNMSIASHSTIGMAVFQCNRSSTFENITIRQQTFGTSGPGNGGILFQAPIDGTLKNIHISNFSYGITIQGYNPLRFENITIDNCHYGIDYYPTYMHISWFEAHRLPTVADDLFFDIDTSGCTFDVRSTQADEGFFPYKDNAYINITGGNLGASIDLFTAGSKRINVGTYAWLNSPAGTFTITHNAAPVATANATGSDQRFNLPRYSSYNNITVDEQCVVTVGGLNSEQAGNFDVYRNGVSGHPLTRTADSITFNAEGGNTYELRTVTPLTPVWELMDDTSKMITLNIGQLIAATIAIAMFGIVSMFLVIIIAGGGRGMRRGYSGGRSRWR